jgi:hypothetical protein
MAKIHGVHVPTPFLVALAMVLAACGANTAIATTTAANPTTPGAVLFQGNFSDPAQQWPILPNPTSSESVSGDNYTVQLNSAGSLDASPILATVQPQDLANVSVSVSTTPTSLRPGDKLGLLCRSSAGHSYAFVLGPRSAGQLAWTIQLRQPQGLRQLASGTTAVPTTSPYLVRGDCIQGGQDHKPVVLALYLGGKLVGQAQDAKLPTPYVGRPGLTVSSAAGGTRVGFSNFQLRAASAP